MPQIRGSSLEVFARQAPSKSVRLLCKFWGFGRFHSRAGQSEIIAFRIDLSNWACFSGWCGNKAAILKAIPVACQRFILCGLCHRYRLALWGVALRPSLSGIISILGLEISSVLLLAVPTRLGEEGGSAVRQTSRCAVDPIDCPRNGLDVLLASLIIEILDSPFCRTKKKLS